MALSGRTVPPATVRVRRQALPFNEEIEWQLLTTLYGETEPLVVGAMGLFFFAIFGWSETHRAWYLYWAGGIATLLVARLLLDRAFRLRGDGPNRIAFWRRSFNAGAFAMGIACGCASIVVLDRAPPLLQMIPLAGVMVIIIGGAARNAGCPGIATGQIVAGLLPPFVACAWIHDRYHLAFCIVIAFETFAAFR